MLKSLLFTLLVCVSISESECKICSSLPNCKYVEFYSGLQICIPFDAAYPHEELFVRSSTWPHDCKYVSTKLQTAPESIDDRHQQKNNDDIMDDLRQTQQQQKENYDFENSPPTQDYSMSTFEIVLGTVTFFSFIFSGVDLFLRCKKMRRDIERNDGYTRFYDHNNSIDSFPLQV